MPKTAKRSIFHAVLGSALFLPVVTARNLHAQDVEKEAQKAKLEENKQAQATETAEEAARRKELEGEKDVAYEEVLADPDNIELNYRYARTQVRHGDVKGASATLERILLVNPNLPNIRLFYAIVLYRLDDLSESKREFTALKSLPMAESLRSEIGDYLGRIENRKKRNHLSGRLSFGYEYDDNRNAAPASTLRLFSDIPIPLSGASQKQGDTSLITIANVEDRHELGSQAGHEIFASGTYYRADQTVVRILNLQAYSLEGGGVYRLSNRTSVTPSLLFDHILLAQTTFLRDRGAHVRVDHVLNRTTALYADFKDVYQDYSPTDVVPVAKQRTGIQVDMTLGGGYLLTPTMKLDGGVTYAVKHAQEHFNQFDRYSVNAAHSWLLGKGTFLLSSLTLNYDQYREPDTSISVKYRRDTTWRGGLTYGLPLSLIKPQLSDLVWTFSYEYYQALSSVTNYAYTNNKYSTLLTYRWDIGL